LSLRIVTSEMYTNLLAAMNMDRQNVNRASQEASTGQSVNSLSDNPMAAGQLVLNRTQVDAVDQFTQSISSVQGSLQVADSALNSVVQSLTQAVSLGTEGGNGTLSTSERTVIAQQVDAIKQQIVGLANTSYQGNYLFAGSLVKTPPYSIDQNNNVSAYAGNTTVNSVQVGAGQKVATNMPGSQLFSANGADVFQALTDLSGAIQTNGNVSGALTEVQNALSNVTDQRTFYGNTLQQLDSENFNLGQEKLTLTQIQNTLVAVEPAKAASDLIQAQTTLQTALAAAGRISQDNLLDYLK